jgi:hypothetical protein
VERVIAILVPTGDGGIARIVEHIDDELGRSIESRSKEKTTGNNKNKNKNKNNNNNNNNTKPLGIHKGDVLKGGENSVILWHLRLLGHDRSRGAGVGVSQGELLS